MVGFEIWSWFLFQGINDPRHSKIGSQKGESAQTPPIGALGLGFHHSRNATTVVANTNVIVVE